MSSSYKTEEKIAEDERQALHPQAESVADELIQEIRSWQVGHRARRARLEIQEILSWPEGVGHRYEHRARLETIISRALRGVEEAAVVDTAKLTRQWDAEPSPETIVGRNGHRHRIRAEKWQDDAKPSPTPVGMPPELDPWKHVSDEDAALCPERDYVRENRSPPHAVSVSILEALAALEHDRWSRWEKWRAENNTHENNSRWTRQRETPYAELSEREKNSDRREALSTIELLRSLGVNLTTSPSPDLTDEQLEAIHGPRDPTDQTDQDRSSPTVEDVAREVWAEDMRGTIDRLTAARDQWVREGILKHATEQPPGTLVHYVLSHARREERESCLSVLQAHIDTFTIEELEHDECKRCHVATMEALIADIRKRGEARDKPELQGG